MPGSKVCEPHIVCVGEAMVVLTPADDGPLRDAERFVRSVGGAELNVALTLAGLGVPAAWLSRLGDDGFGQHVAAVAGAAGVDLKAVAFDAGRPTGLYVKEPGTAPDGSRRSAMRYYRDGSAASALCPDDLGLPAVAEVDVVEPVGAGDAFAAGYLAGRWYGLDVRSAVVLGHRCAAAALVVREDRPVTLPAWEDLAG